MHICTFTGEDKPQVVQPWVVDMHLKKLKIDDKQIDWGDQREGGESARRAARGVGWAESREHFQSEPLPALNLSLSWSWLTPTFEFGHKQSLLKLETLQKDKQAKRQALWTCDIGLVKIWINSQSLEDTQVGYISQKYTLEKYT